MRKYDNIDDFDSRCPAGTSWQRCSQALQQVCTLPPEEAHSIGDSLTYVRTKRPTPRPHVFVGRRRYRIVIMALEEPVNLSVAVKSDLDVAEPYSDLTDRELLIGNGECTQIEPGEILVLDIDEAMHVSHFGPPVGMIFLTIEAATFHNK